MRGSVLIVEDDPSVRDVLQVVLDSEGYEVVLAADGFEALDRLDEGLPDLVLLDLMLPRLDGASVVAELERRGLWPGIPIVVLSAATQADRWAARIRADGFIPKPFDIEILLDEVHRLTLGRALAAV